jgi:predicted nucleic acid-binding protein
MIALDASVLIAHLNPTDAHHADATGLLLSAHPGSLLVHSMTLAEVLVGGVRIGRGAQMRADLLATGIQITPHDQTEPLRLAELRVTTGLTLPDCCVLDTAIGNNASVATFDQALAAAAARRGISVQP